MKTKIDVNELKKELENLQQKMSNKTMLFIIVGTIATLITILFLICKIKNKIELLCDGDDLYYDEDDFYEDYHALDYEDEDEELL